MQHEFIKNIQLLCLDVDGVLTDGSIYLDDHAVETKRFHVRDGTGIAVWLKLGFDVAIITGRTGQSLHHRAKELGIRHVIDGAARKGEHFNSLLQQLKLDPTQTAVLVDDLPDLPFMKLAGYPMAVADAAEEVRATAKYITSTAGGHGAVREAIEHLLKAKGRWKDAQQLYEQ